MPARMEHANHRRKSPRNIKKWGPCKENISSFVLCCGQLGVTSQLVEDVFGQRYLESLLKLCKAPRVPDVTVIGLPALVSFMKDGEVRATTEQARRIARVFLASDVAGRFLDKGDGRSFMAEVARIICSQTHHVHGYDHQTTPLNNSPPSWKHEEALWEPHAVDRLETTGKASSIQG